VEILRSKERAIILVLIFTALSLLVAIIVHQAITGQVLGLIDSKIVSITGDAPHIVSVQIQPESRIPPSSNNELPLQVEIRQPNSLAPIVTITVSSDNAGVAALGDVSSTVLPPALYDIAIKGQSHLNKVFEDQDFNGPVVRSYILTANQLKAGDAHPSADNYVNGLDISYITINLFTTDTRADLTHDGMVNSLDYAALLKNLYAYGDQ
jgi:hypothetical protein